MTTDISALVAALEEELRAEGCIEPHGDIHAPRETFRGVVKAALSAVCAQSPAPPAVPAAYRWRIWNPITKEWGDWTAGVESVETNEFTECEPLFAAPPQEGERACCKRMRERTAQMAEHGGHYDLAAHIRALAEE